MPFDQHKNLAIAVVAVAPSPPDTGLTLTVAAGHGARYPVPPFDVTIWLATEYPNPANAEVARCTALAGDALTLIRAQGGTTARLVQPGDLIAESITAQYLQSLEAAIGTTPAPPTLHAPTHAEGGADPVTVTGLAGYPGGTANFLRADGTFAAPPINGGVPAAHRLTHETGGADALQNLSAAILTSGNLPFARVPVSGTSRLLGRGSTGGNGPMQEIALGAGLTMTNTTLSASGGGAPAAHASTHASGGSDPVTVTTLAGYPGGTANFLRADGTFAVPPGGGAGADEVFVGATDPGATYELWYDTAAVSPTNNYALTNVANAWTQGQNFPLLSVAPVVIEANGVRLNTADGADSGTLYLTGGGSIISPTRGASIALAGNEAGGTGSIAFQAGGQAGSKITFDTGGGFTRGTIHPSGGFSWGSTTDPGAGTISATQFQGQHVVDRTNSLDSILVRTVNRVDGYATMRFQNTTADAIVGVSRSAGADIFTGSLGNTLAVGTLSNTGVQFGTNGLSRGVIHPSGGFSWGGTTDPGAGAFLVGASAVPGAAHVKMQAAEPGVQISGPGTGTYTLQYFLNGNGAVGSIVTTGNATTYNTTSDARLKTPLSRHTDPAVLRNTVIHNFVWKRDGTAGRGVFAQEAALVAPFAVSVGTDETDEEGRLTHPWGVDYSKYVPDLITGWQAHDNGLDEMRRDVMVLTNRVRVLEGQPLLEPVEHTSVMQRIRAAFAVLFPAWITP